MATINSIGIRIGVVVGDVENQVGRVTRSLGRLQAAHARAAAGVDRLKLGFNQIADGWQIMKLGAERAAAQLPGFIAGLRVWVLGFRAAGATAGEYLYKSVSFGLMNISNLLTTANVGAAVGFAKRFWSVFGTAAMYPAIGSAVSSAAHFMVNLFSLRLLASGKMLRTAWSGATAAMSGGASIMGSLGPMIFNGLQVMGRGAIIMFQGLMNVLGGTVILIVAVATAVVFLGVAFYGAFLVISGMFLGGLITLYTMSLRTTMQVMRMAREFDMAFNSAASIVALASQSEIQNNMLERWLQHMSAFLGEITAGSDVAARNLRMLGLSAAQFAGADAGQAFDIIVNHLRSLPGNFERARGAAIIFGRDYRRVLDIVNNPRLVSPSSQMRAGITLDTRQVGIMQMASQAQGQLSTIFQGVQTQVAAELSPLFIGIVQTLDAWIERAGGVRVIFSGIMETMIPWITIAIGGFGSLLNMMQLLVSTGLTWYGMLNHVLATIIQISQMGRRTPAVLAAQARGTAAYSAGTGMRDELTSGHGWGAHLMDAWGEVRGRARGISAGAGAVGVNRYAAEGTSGFVYLTSALRRWTNEAGEFRHLDPFATFRNSLRELNKLTQNGLLTGDEGALGTLHTVEALQSSLGTGNTRSPSAMETQSREASSAVAQLFNSSDRQTPQARMVALMEEAKLQAAIRLQYAREVRDALVRLRTV